MREECGGTRCLCEARLKRFLLQESVEDFYTNCVGNGVNLRERVDEGLSLRDWRLRGSVPLRYASSEGFKARLAFSSL